MSFERFRVQQSVEVDLGCLNLERWNSYKAKFEEYRINSTRKERLAEDLKQDSIDLYYKGIFSLCDALKNIADNYHSWAVVKLYYSVFYLLRCSLATQDIAFVKNKGIYTLKLEEGEKPIRRDKGDFYGERLAGDHKTTIATFIKVVGENDLLQTNTINGELVYLWLMKLRDRVNYRERCFYEPTPKYFFAEIFETKKLNDYVRIYVDDETYAYCFDPDHACLAVPLKVSLDVSEKLKFFAGENLLGDARMKVLKKMVEGARLNEIRRFASLISL